MPPQLASLAFAVAIAGLFLLDRDRTRRPSPALWLPIIWLAIGGSRNVSQWLNPAGAGFSPDQVLEGSPLDRVIMSALIALGLAVLAARGTQTAGVLRRNIPLLVFFVYCLASIVWSDYPFVAFKRWIKVLGNVVMVLIVLTDPNREAAVRKFFTRTAFLLLPASVLLIKYYPEYGRFYDRWEGTAFYTGVAIDKNMLGCIAFVFGIAMLWRIVGVLREGGEGRGRQLLAFSAVLAVSVWLLLISQSATSLGCLLLGCTLIVILTFQGHGRPWVVHVLLFALAAAGSVTYLFPGVFVFVVESLGRDPTLTGRTELWTTLLEMTTHPWLGAGFESFFLGDRLELLWEKYWWQPNQAHNGYIEIYLTLGRVGLVLMGVLMWTGYRNAVQVFREDPMAGSLRLAFLIVALVYNVTEAAFKVVHPIWIVFLLAAARTAVTGESRAAERVRATPAARLPAAAHYGGALPTRWMPAPARRRAPARPAAPSRALPLHGSSRSSIPRAPGRARSSE
jgi:O-antigen ligase